MVETTPPQQSSAISLMDERTNPIGFKTIGELAFFFTIIEVRSQRCLMLARQQVIGGVFQRAVFQNRTTMLAEARD